MSTFTEPETKPALEDEPPQKKSWVPTCLIGCGVILVICLLLCGGGMFWAYSQGPIVMMDAIVAQIDESDLPEEEKREITKQVDRVKTAYSDGDVNLADFFVAIQDFAQSPFMSMVLMFVVEEQRLEMSGLTDEEKDVIRRQIDRVYRGIAEEKIDMSDLAAPMDIISNQPPDPNQPRDLKPRLSDEQLKEFGEELKQLADAKEIPDEEYEVEISSQLKKIVDRMLDEE